MSTPTTSPHYVSWYMSGSTAIDRLDYVSAIVVAAGLPYTKLSPPKWWSAFTTHHAAPTVTPDSRWELGHAIGSQFGGPQTSDNVIPQYGIVNRSPWETCEKRIADALACGGCVEIHVWVTYSGTQPIKPLKFHLKATGLGAAKDEVDIDEEIDNVYSPRPKIPPDCML